MPSRITRQSKDSHEWFCRRAAQKPLDTHARADPRRVQVKAEKGVAAELSTAKSEAGRIVAGAKAEAAAIAQREASQVDLTYSDDGEDKARSPRAGGGGGGGAGAGAGAGGGAAAAAAASAHGRCGISWQNDCAISLDQPN
jgi:hypothetical protein